MISVVTGAAGFVGAVLSQRLLDEGSRVIGIDNFLDSYSRKVKEDRVNAIAHGGGFSFIEGSIAELDLTAVLENADWVFHTAAQAGVRTSWQDRFKVYADSNILGTQRMLEAAGRASVRRFVYSSSSSVYGNTEIMPTPEDAALKPLSPYAVSKLAGEHLCNLYRENFGIPTVVLRYFTVYGPKPRPDQAVCIFSRALIEGREIEVFGDGEQLRGMTYVDDVVEANLLAAERECVGETLNIGGGVSITVNELIHRLAEISQREAKVLHRERVHGDARDTLADIRRARRVIGWQPKIDLDEGLRKTLTSIKEYYYANCRMEAG